MSGKMRTFIIIACAVLASGAILCAAAMGLVGFDLSRIGYSSEDYTRTSKTLPAGDYDVIATELLTGDVRVEPSQDGDIHITYYTGSHEGVELSTEGRRILLKTVINGQRKWYEYFNFGFKTDVYTTVIALPESYSGELELATTTGEIDVSGHWRVKALSAVTTTGGLSISGLSVSGDAAVAVSTGGISLNGLSVEGRLEVSATTSGARLQSVTAAAIDCATATGGLDICSTSAKGAMTLVCTTGDVYLDGAEAAELYIKTTTGSVSGTVAGAEEDYSVMWSTTTGDCDLVQSRGGERTLEVGTTTGSIELDFAG